MVLTAPAAVFADGPLRSIIISGNEKTDRSTVLGIITVQSQTYVNTKLVREVDDRLINSGLFKKVRVRKSDNHDGTTDLHVTVTEKQLWFIFPIFQAWSSRYSGGAVFGESNLFASNAGTLVAAQGGNKLNRFFSVFDAKNVFESNVSVRTWVLVRSDDVPLYSGNTQTGEINIKDTAIAVIPGYQWTPTIRTSVNLGYRYVDYGYSTLVPESGMHGNDVSVAFEFAHDSLRRREALLKGDRLAASFEFSEASFGADFTYHIEQVEWTHAFAVSDFFNYVGYFNGQIADRALPFHKDLTLGGSSLRGYAEEQFRGDTKILLKQDMMFPLMRAPKFSVFGTVFYDIGLLYREADGLGRSDLHSGTGAGFRVSLANVLAPVIGLDFAYGIEDKRFLVYFAVGLVNF